jgi:hypothetical protein
MAIAVLPAPKLLVNCGVGDEEPFPYPNSPLIFYPQQITNPLSRRAQI